MRSTCASCSGRARPWASLRGATSGPLIADTLAAGLAFGYAGREGFTRNDVTGHDLDSRSAFFGKGQLLWKPSMRWEARAMFSGERARDGDYALNDLGSLRSRPFHAARDVEGFTHRDILAPTIQVAYAGPSIDFATTTGFLKWKTDDLTDLDYTPLPLVTRTNAEEDFQFTEEARISSARAAPVVLSDRVTMKWQAGVFVFTQTGVVKGEAVGQHVILLDSPNDTLMLVHDAKSRRGFAQGAVLAAEWVKGKRGFFEFREVLKAASS